MRAVIFAGSGMGGKPTFEEVKALWESELTGVAGLDRFEVLPSERKLDENLGDADAVMGIYVSDGMLSEAFLDRHPNLRYVSSSSHGYGAIDFSLLRDRGVFFTNTVHSQQAIAEYAFALLLDICKGAHAHSEYYKGPRFDSEVKGFSFLLSPQIELYEKTFGILGLGHIGLAAARIAAGFGMKPISYPRHKKRGEEYGFVEQVSLEELLSRSDVISIHCPLTDETRGMVNAELIAKMKDGVILINTARGGIIDEDALCDALISRKVYAAGLDVLDGEPLKKKARIMDIDNTTLTPHIAWAPPETRLRGVRAEAEQFKAWLAGTNTRNLAEES